MPSFPNEQRVAIAIGVPVVALLLYLWFRRRKSSKFSDDGEDFYHEEGESEVVASANERTIEVKIPLSAVGVIIGKSGANIKKIEKESGARVNLKDVNEESESAERIVLIQGEREKVKRAEILVKKIVAEQPVVRTEEAFVPQHACGRIIGKGGQNIRHMCTVSGTKIKIDRDDTDMSSNLRKCLITGTSDQIAIAKCLLDEKIAEDKEMRMARGDSAPWRSGHPLRKMNAIPASREAIQFPKSDDFFEVFVSAIDNPGHFWVQLVTSESPAFDRMSGELTSLYASLKSRSILNAFKVGDICCAPFEYDSSWYRARILEIHKDGMVDLFYVDFGDTGKISKERLRELKKEHFKLPFQAVECFLANVRPKDDSWSEESTDKFERLTYCAQWVSVMAHAVKHCGEIPCLELIDTSGEQDVNINEEMVKAQYAVYDVSFSPQKTLAGPLEEVEANGEEADEIKEGNVQKEANASVESDGGEQIHKEYMIAEVSSERMASSNLQDEPDSGAPWKDGLDGVGGLHDPVNPESDSPVRAALVKRIPQDYMSVPEDSISGDSPLGAQEALLGVAQEQEQEALSECLAGPQSQEEVSNVKSAESYSADGPDPSEEQHVDAPDKAGYRSTLSITPSSRRTIAATFTGNRAASESSVTSVKSVSTAVHRQVVSTKRSYVSSVTLPTHKTDELVVSLTPSLQRIEDNSPPLLESPIFKASNESSTFSAHAVRSEIHRTVMQNNGSETKTQTCSSRLDQKLGSDVKPTLTYEINFESLGDTEGMERYTIKKTFEPSLESAPPPDFVEASSASYERNESGQFKPFLGENPSDVYNSVALETALNQGGVVNQGVDAAAWSASAGVSREEDNGGNNLTPSGSLMDVSNNTVIDEEDECDSEEEEDSESAEPDSDTESFMSAREDVTSDTDTAAYLTAQAGGSSTSLDADVAAADSTLEEANTPVNSDTEREDEDDGERDLSPRDPSTPRQSVDASDELLDEHDALKSLRYQTVLLGGSVVSDGDLGYKGDSEEGLASSEDIRDTSS